MRICWAQWLFIAVIVILGAAQMLSACGNKGPLYLPSEEPQKAESIDVEDPLKEKKPVENQE